MYLICYGTRPEVIKLFPLINSFKEHNIIFETLFSGQHIDLINDFKDLIPSPDHIFKNVMEHGQSLNKLTSKILINMDNLLKSKKNIKYIIIQGDTTSAYSIALAGFNHRIKIIHLEAGLRTYNKQSPFPEEINRCLISQIADIHLSPTITSTNNLKKENIINNIFYVGNTIVDAYDYVIKHTNIPNTINNIIKQNNYIIVTLHRRENRGEKIISMWKQLNYISLNYNTFKIIYIKHPSLPDVDKYLNNKIILLDPLDYISMVHLISNCQGIITDSGGLQEEAISAKKKILICRNTTERPETIEYNYGLLINDKIVENINFLLTNIDINITINPYGNDVCNKIINYLKLLK